MATDLFSQYFDNPTKSYIYTNLKCNGASADEMSFDIVDDAGTISDSASILSKIDLSSVHVPCTQYSNEMKTIEPNSFIYVRGISYGDSYESKTYHPISKAILSDEDWEYESAITFVMKTLDNIGRKNIYFVRGFGSEEEGIKSIEAVQDFLDEKKIPVTVEIDEKKIIFTSTVAGFEFSLNHVLIWKTTSLGQLKTIMDQIAKASISEYPEITIDPSTVADVDTAFNNYLKKIKNKDFQKIYKAFSSLNGYSKALKNSPHYSSLTLSYIFEDIYYYVPAKKYKNGAMKGCLVYATYPVFNADSITDTQRSLMLGHVRDRVVMHSSILNVPNVPLSIEEIKDVNESYDSLINAAYATKYVIPYEFDFDTSTGEPIEDRYKEMIGDDTIGLIDYCQYLTDNEEWMNIGQLYIRTTAPDDLSSKDRNLMRSFIIYNPNDFPVVVNYMTFA